jgi:hypothetical protein
VDIPPQPQSLDLIEHEKASSPRNKSLYILKLEFNMTIGKILDLMMTPSLALDANSKKVIFLHEFHKEGLCHQELLTMPKVKNVHV